MQIRYYETAWNDVSNSPGWFKKLCLLALINLIPIFGQIVTFGYLFGWARDIAWGVHAPLPDRIFGNEDGKLYRRGWFALVIIFVFALVPGILASVGSGITLLGSSVYLAADGSVAVTGGSAIAGIFGSIILLASAVLSVIISMVALVGCLRASIYDRLSAGFQIGKLWAMARRDLMGLVKIFLMTLVVGIVGSIVLSMVIGLIFTVWGITAGLSAGGIVMSAVNEGMSDYALAQTLLTSGVAGGLIFSLIIVMLITTFLTLILTEFIEMIQARAIGYWISQFDVARWGGQDDPLPFETAPAGQGTGAYAAPAASAAIYGYQQAQPQQAAQQPMQSAQQPMQSPVQQHYSAQPVDSAAPYAAQSAYGQQQYAQQASASSQPYAQQPYGQAYGQQPYSQAYGQQPFAAGQSFGEQPVAAGQSYAQQPLVAEQPVAQPYAVEQPVQPDYAAGQVAQQVYAAEQVAQPAFAVEQPAYAAEQVAQQAPVAEQPAQQMTADQFQSYDAGKGDAQSSVFERAKASVDDAFASVSDEPAKPVEQASELGFYNPFANVPPANKNGE